MAREYGQLRHDIWNDDDWRDLTLPAQWLYMVLLSDPKLNYCGVAPWHIGKLAQKSSEGDGLTVLLAAQELTDRLFIVVDEETEEALIRSYLKHDPILKNPRLAVTMSKDFGAVGSNKIRAALVYELGRLAKSNPDWVAWEKPQVKTILRQRAVSAKEIEPDFAVASAIYLPSGLPSAFETTKAAI